MHPYKHIGTLSVQKLHIWNNTVCHIFYLDLIVYYFKNLFASMYMRVIIHSTAIKKLMALYIRFSNRRAVRLFAPVFSVYWGFFLFFLIDSVNSSFGV